MIPAGDLRERITLLSSSATSNTVGEDETLWSAQTTVWAARRNLSLRDINRAAGTQDGAEAKFLIRTRDDVTPGWQIEHKGTRYQVTAIDRTTDDAGLLLLVRRA